MCHAASVRSALKQREAHSMAEKWQDYLYIGIPDMDHDGDRDLQDYW